MCSHLVLSGMIIRSWIAVVEQITLATLLESLQFFGGRGGYIIEDRIRFSSFLLLVFPLVNNARYVMMILVPGHVPEVCSKS